MSLRLYASVRRASPSESCPRIWIWFLSHTSVWFFLLSPSNHFLWQFISSNGPVNGGPIFHLPPPPPLVSPFGFSITFLFIFSPCTTFLYLRRLTPSFQSPLLKNHEDWLVLHSLDSVKSPVLELGRTKVSDTDCFVCGLDWVMKLERWITSVW